MAQMTQVSHKGELLGRMEFVLFANTSPLAAENMRRMCTGGLGGLSAPTSV